MQNSGCWTAGLRRTAWADRLTAAAWAWGAVRAAEAGPPPPPPCPSGSPASRPRPPPPCCVAKGKGIVRLVTAASVSEMYARGRSATSSTEYFNKSSIASSPTAALLWRIRECESARASVSIVLRQIGSPPPPRPYKSPASHLRPLPPCCDAEREFHRLPCCRRIPRQFARSIAASMSSRMFSIASAPIAALLQRRMQCTIDGPSQRMSALFPCRLGFRVSMQVCSTGATTTCCRFNAAFSNHAALCAGT